MEGTLRLEKFCFFNHVEPAPQWIARESEKGRRTDAVCQLKKVLYGCRRGVHKWVNWLAEILHDLELARRGVHSSSACTWRCILTISMGVALPLMWRCLLKQLLLVEAAVAT
eukprot:5020138-Amphidinium_carterae.1